MKKITNYSDLSILTLILYCSFKTYILIETILFILYIIITKNKDTNKTLDNILLVLLIINLFLKFIKKF